MNPEGGDVMKKYYAAGLLFTGFVTLAVPLVAVRHEDLVFEHPHTYEQINAVNIPELTRPAVTSTANIALSVADSIGLDSRLWVGSSG
jgi:hypothetical protein